MIESITGMLTNHETRYVVLINHDWPFMIS